MAVIKSNEARGNFLKLIRAWNNVDEKNTRKEHKALDQYVNMLIENGWDRKMVFNLFQDVLKKEELDQSIVDILWDYETSITGDVHVSGLKKFPNESLNGDELLKYVRSKSWTA